MSRFQLAPQLSSSSFIAILKERTNFVCGFCILFIQREVIAPNINRIMSVRGLEDDGPGFVGIKFCQEW